MVMSLLVQPHRMVLPILMPGGILLTRLVIGVGVHVTQVVAGLDNTPVYIQVESSQEPAMPLDQQTM